MSHVKARSRTRRSSSEEPGERLATFRQRYGPAHGFPRVERYYGLKGNPCRSLIQIGVEDDRKPHTIWASVSRCVDKMRDVIPCKEAVDMLEIATH